MSQLGKILLYVALVGALVAGVFAYLLISNFDGAKATLVTTQQQKDASDKEAAKQKALAQAATDAKNADDAKVTARLEQLRTKLKAKQ